MDTTERTSLIYHLSKKAKKTMTTINNGWTIILADYTQKDVQNIITNGFNVFSSTGNFECEGIQRGSLVVSA